MDKISFLGSENELSRVPFGSILKETREKTTVENEDTLLSCAINGIFRNDEMFSHFRGSSNIGYIKIKKNDLILSAQNLHLGNANVNLRFEHGIISPAYKVYRITGAEPEYIAQWVKRPATNQFFLDATTEGASQCRKNIDWDALYKQCIELPSLEEQKEIAKLLMSLDSKIAFEKTEVRKLKDFKSAMLTKMFPKKGENVPEIRFDGFTDAWEQRKLSEVVREVKRTDETSRAPVMMITAESGFINQSERYSTNNAGQSLKKYILLEKGELAYNHGASKLRPFGSCFALTTEEEARIPFVYHCFSSDSENAEFLSIELNGKAVEKQLRRIVSSGARMDGLLNISFDEYTSIPILLPKKDEQNKIANYFRSLDHLITLHQRKYEKLIDTKKAFLEKLIGGEK